MNLSAKVAQRIVQRSADSLGTSVSVADTSGRIIASTEPEQVGLAHPLARMALASGELADGPAAGPPGVSLPLVYEDSVAGAIVLHGEPGQARQVIRVVKTLAELLIHQSAVIDRLPSRRQLIDGFLADLLAGHFSADSDAPLQRGALLDIDLSVARVVVAFDVAAAIAHLAGDERAHDTLPRIARSQQVERARAHLVRCARQIPGARRSDVHGFVDERWMVLLAVADAEPQVCQRYARRQAQQFLDDVSRTMDARSSAGIGRPAPAWSDLARSFSEARFAVACEARLYGGGHAVTVDDLGLAGFLAAPDIGANVSHAARLLSPLDGEHELLATLELFFAKDLSMSSTAEALMIHRHTLAYRLDKITRLTALDPRCFTGAEQLHAALLLRRLSGPLPEAAR